MRKKTKNMIVIGLVCVMLSGVLSGCGKEAKAVVNQQSGNTGNTNYEPETTTEVIGNNAEEMTGTDKENIVFYEDKGEILKNINTDDLSALEPMVSFTLNNDTEFYDSDGHIAGYIKAGSTVNFNLGIKNWYAFNMDENTILLMRAKDIAKSNENAQASNTTESTVTSDAFAGTEDDNIILYSDSTVKEQLQSGKIDFNYGKVIENLTYEKDEILIVNTGDLLLYNGNGENIGCMKTNGKATVTEVSSDSNWGRFKNPIPNTEYDYLYLTKSSLLRYSTSTNTSIKEVPKTENKTENTENNVTSKPTTEAPVYSEPITEQPVVAESDKYTPEEAIAIYRSILEENGMTWDPSLKDGGSWGTGFIPLEKGYVDKGWIEQDAKNSLEAFAFNGMTNCYLEITGSDENYVYTMAWGD